MLTANRKKDDVTSLSQINERHARLYVYYAESRPVFVFFPRRKAWALVVLRRVIVESRSSES